jgi:phosphate transport system substrate-binding protein
MSSELEYVPLPEPVENIVRRAWAEIKDGSGKPIAFK